MLKLAQAPGDQRTSEPHLADVSQSPSHEQRYFAFLSYSHHDHATADWLHRELERFRVPPALEGQGGALQIIGGTLRPIFRDRQELAAADDLGAEIRGALARSQYLIVLCSPAAARSKWTEAEVDAFKRIHPNGRVLAAIVAGEPFASEIPDRAQEECFPPALRRKYDRRGRPTSKSTEPIAADLRESGDGKRVGVLKLVAGMLGVGLDELVRRDAQRRHRRVIWTAVASIAAVAVTAALMTAAIDGRIAAVHARNDASDQRTQTLSLEATAAIQNGDTLAAQRLYEKALSGTAEALRRYPNDPARIFDHAQNVFHIGDLAAQRGDRRTAEKSMIEYRRLAGRLVDLQPANLTWRMEAFYADTNIGVMLFQDRRFEETGARFEAAAKEGNALAKAVPVDRPREEGVAQVFAWLADTRFNQGRLKEAVSLREQHLAMLNSLSSQRSGDADFQMELTNAQLRLGSAYAATGESKLALEHFRVAVANADRVIPLDKPANWYRTAINARLTLASFALGAGDRAQALSQTRAACDLAEKLSAEAPNDRSWQKEQRECWFIRGRLALAGSRIPEAVSDAERAVDVSKAVNSGDHAADRFAQAKAYCLLGDAQSRAGNAAAAHDSWSRALAAMSADTTETPREMDEHARVLERLGHVTKASEIRSKLAAIGYHSLE